MRADFEKKSGADFSSIKEFNEYIDKARQFTKRAANKFELVNPETGAHITYNVLNKVEKEIKRVNRIKEREFSKIKDLPHMEMGRKTGLTIGEAAGKKVGFSDPKFENFRPLEFNPKTYAGDRDAQIQLHKIKERHQGDFIAERELNHFKNYLQSLHTAFNISSHPMHVILADDVWEIHDKIVDMGLETFTRLYYEGKLPTLKFIYGKDAREIKMMELQNAFLGEE
jgi:hypothetical protein